ncbi:hypothetical protein H9633_12855 [Microbacterium sp. Re1]|uniref:Uncharacterized protein n=1 Tax=Microbacterium commune TaxID=2762219 RepID=A0ABR8W834_9MICO|nr:hypothetical protein [Microbacterium commune]MBD8013175.1 hypothetical protein [Microbacterium commune]
MTYPDIRTSNIDGSSIRALAGIPDTLKEQGISIPKGITEAQQRHAHILEHIAATAAAVNVEDAHTAAARALAGGEGNAAQLTAAAATQIVNSKDPSAPLSKILNRARDLAAHDLQAAYAEPGDTWITKHLRPALEKAIATFTTEAEYAAPIDPFMDPTAADYLTRNPRVDDAWRTIRTIYETTRTLRRYRCIPTTTRSADAYEWEGDGEHHEHRGGQHLIASIRDNLRDNNITWFVAALQHGMTPVLLTEQEVAGA